jgi:hypothetical protein
MASLAVVFTLGALAGCASGPIRGQLVRPNEEPQPVTMKYSSSLFGGSGKLSALLPSGERYAGTYVLTPYATDHHIVSTLDGDRGGNMVCRFRLNAPGVGPDSGGFGRCQLSEGGFIDAEF